MIVNTAYTIQSNLLIGNKEYTPNYIFVEYKNVTDPTTRVSDTTTVNDTAAHYDTLGTGNVDYIEIPITIKPRVVTASSGKHAAIEYSATTAGISKGKHNIAFDATNNSLIYGMGLVAKIDESSKVLFAKISLSDTEQILKAANDLYINWKVEF